MIKFVKLFLYEGRRKKYSKYSKYVLRRLSICQSKREIGSDLLVKENRSVVKFDKE